MDPVGSLVPLSICKRMRLKEREVGAGGVSGDGFEAGFWWNTVTLIIAHLCWPGDDEWQQLQCYL